MTTTPQGTSEPTTAQLVAAFGSALLPLAGPYGVAASTIMTAGLDFLQRINGAGRLVTMADLESIAATTEANLNQLAANVTARRS